MVKEILLKDTIYSLAGKPLLPPNESEEVIQQKEEHLKEAMINFGEDSLKLDHIIWLGRRLAYLYRYKEAIDVYTMGIENIEEAPELYRHRGHRFISSRKFDLAIEDFSKAANLAEGRSIEIEPDGIPNRLNSPLPL